ncbi:MAG: biotin synthase, partial [Deltaproteobacteria bacterium]
MNTVKHFERALKWIENYSIPGSGIAVSSASNLPYPEVTGYFIPSLLAWNEIDRAVSYGRWLLSCQHPEGCWGDPNENRPYAFDTGQIVKGLLALAKASETHEWDKEIRGACEWLISLIDESGEPIAPDKKAWGDQVPLAVLLYSFEAVKRAGEYFNEPTWVKRVEKSVDWFLRDPKLTDFTHLSHFHAYVLEALCDLGHYDRAREGMEKVAALQNKKGAVPAFQDVKWVCSTGLFQYAIVWYKLGDNERGDRAFSYATQLQNKSGGWYGSYGWFAKYFPKAEIAWAVKYFLD